MLADDLVDQLEGAWSPWPWVETSPPVSAPDGLRLARSCRETEPIPVPMACLESLLDHLADSLVDVPGQDSERRSVSSLFKFGFMLKR